MHGHPEHHLCIPAAEAFTWIASFDGCMTSADVSKANVSVFWCLTGVAPGNVTCAKSFCWPFTRGAARIGLPRMPGILSFSISCTCRICRKEAHTRNTTACDAVRGMQHVCRGTAETARTQAKRLFWLPCLPARPGLTASIPEESQPKRLCILTSNAGQNCRITVLAFIQTVKPGPSRYQEGFARRLRWQVVRCTHSSWSVQRSTDPEGIARCNDVRPRAGAKESVRCCHVRGIVRA